MFDYSARRRRLSERMQAEGIAALFLAPSADLEYLTGVERQIPNFGEVSYAHGWVTGAFFVPARDPVFVFPRMFAAFDLPNSPRGRSWSSTRPTTARAVRARRRGRRRSGTVAVGDRIWASGAPARQRLGFERLETARASSTSCAGSRTMPSSGDGTGDRDGRAGDGRRDAARAPGVSMAELVEAVEHELRARGSRCPSFTTHMFTASARRLDSGTATAWSRSRGHVGDVRLRRRRRRLLLRLRAHGLLRRAVRRVPRDLRRDARRAGGGARRRARRARSHAT